MDIDPGRLADTEAVAKLLAQSARANPTIEATTDLRAALDGADYAINMIQVGGYRPSTVIDFEIPKRYGLRQTIGDTLGIGGIMRALRTIPVMLDFARTMEEVCPDVLFLNYTNPMAMLCMAMNRATAIKTVGLCHSVHNTAADIADWLDIPFEEVNFVCAGINHVAFMLRYERDGEDLYPALRQFAAEHREPAWERVRFEVLRRFGYFVTESSEHFSEYVPWFIKPGRDDLIQKFNIPLDEYPARCEDQIADWADFRAALTSADPEAMPRYQEARRGRLHGMDARRIAVVEKEDPALAAAMREEALAEQHEEESGHSGEYGTLIIHSAETGQERVVYGNVENWNSITNLPASCTGRSAVPRRPQRRAADDGWHAPAATGGADANQHQCPGTDGHGVTDRETGARLPGGDARSAHGGRARSRADLRPCRRSARGPREHDSGDGVRQRDGCDTVIPSGVAPAPVRHRSTPTPRR